MLEPGQTRIESYQMYMQLAGPKERIAPLGPAEHGEWWSRQLSRLAPPESYIPSNADRL